MDLKLCASESCSWVKVCIRTTKGKGSPEKVCGTTGKDGRTPVLTVGYAGVRHSWKGSIDGVDMYQGARVCTTDNPGPTGSAWPWGGVHNAGYTGAGCGSVNPILTLSCTPKTFSENGGKVTCSLKLSKKTT